VAIPPQILPIGIIAVLSICIDATKNAVAVMTRINVVPVEELCDQHLLSEYKGIFTIPKKLISGKLTLEYPNRPDHYVIGAGHEKFFTNKLRFLFNRAELLDEELILRGLPAVWDWPEHYFATIRYWNDWRPQKWDLRHNRRVLEEKRPKNAKWSDYV